MIGGEAATFDAVTPIDREVHLDAGYDSGVEIHLPAREKAGRFRVDEHDGFAPQLGGSRSQHFVLRVFEREDHAFTDPNARRLAADGAASRPEIPVGIDL
jgi:hypothetical protein